MERGLRHTAHEELQEEGVPASPGAVSVIPHSWGGDSVEVSEERAWQDEGKEGYVPNKWSKRNLSKGVIAAMEEMKDKDNDEFLGAEPKGHFFA